MTQTPTDSPNYCEVYDEPQHRFHCRNAYTNIYEIELAPQRETVFHRHCEDTVYFVIADTKVRESFHDKPSILTQAQAGGTMCRAHKDEHLIHQVQNVGDANMHLIGAEALARPAQIATEAMDISAHKLAWESGRFRTYDVASGSQATAIEYRVHGLLVALGENDIGVHSAAGGGRANVCLKPGAYLWVEPPYCVELPANFRGIFAEWI